MNLNIGNIGVRGRGSPAETSAKGRSADRADRRDLPNKRLTKQAIFYIQKRCLPRQCRVFAQANAMLAKTKLRFRFFLCHEYVGKLCIILLNNY